MKHFTKHALIVSFIALFSTSTFADNIAENVNLAPKEVAVKPKAKKQRDLDKYIITGDILTAFDVNKGFIYDERNPEFTITFEDDNGNRASAVFKCHVRTIGFSFGLSLRYYVAKFIGADFSLKDASRKRGIEFGKGFFFERNLLHLGLGVPEQLPINTHSNDKNLENIISNFISRFTSPTYWIGLGFHACSLQNRPGKLILTGPFAILSHSIGIVTGGNLTMTTKIKFDDLDDEEFESSDDSGDAEDEEFESENDEKKSDDEEFDDYDSDDEDES